MPAAPLLESSLDLTDFDDIFHAVLECVKKSGVSKGE
jgi:hypothetical protein